MISLAKFSVKKLIGYAVRAERDSHNIYRRLSRRLKNPLLREKFEVLAFEEKKHGEILESLYGSLYGDERLEVPESVDARLLPGVTIRPSSTLIDILAQAMEAEKSAQDFYASLAGRVKTTKRKILEYLSKVEKSHYLMLRSEYALAQAYDDYGEKDIDKIIT